MKTPLATFFALLTCGAMLNSPAASSQEPVDPPNARAEIAEFFEQYKSATADATGEKLTSLYDFETMTREIVAEAGVELPDFARQGMATALSHQISQQFQLFGGTWYRHKVVSIHFFGDGDQAEVYVRSWNEHQETSRDIFWLRRENNTWRIFDFMDLSTSLACTKLAALGLKQGLSGGVSATSIDTLRLLMSAVVLIGQDDLDGASEAMERLMGRPVPVFAESIRWSFAAAVALMDDAARSLEHLDKATAFQPDLPLAEYMRAVAYNQLGRHEQAAASARQFMMRFGDDADAYQELAVALAAMDKPEEAIVELRKALADTPNSLLNVEQLGLLLPVDQKHELGAYFQNLHDHSDSFQYLADSFEAQQDGDALEVLVKSMETINAQEPLLDYYRIAVMSTRGQHAPAWDLASQVLQSIDQEDENRDLYEWMSQVQAIYADKLLESYQDAGDPQSFARVAFAEVIELDQLDRATAMLDAHLMAFPSDPDAHLMAGDLDYYQDRFEQADQHYAAGLSLQPEDRDVLNNLIYSRALAWHRMGKPLQAYRELEPKDLVFLELSRILSDEDDDETLEELLQLRQQDAPESLLVAHLSAAVRFEREDYNGVIMLLKASHTNPNQPSDEVNAEIGFMMGVDELLIRSLLRTNQFDAAGEAANEVTEEDERAFYQALVQAAKGDHDAFAIAYRRCQDEYGYGQYSFIYDIDFPDGFAGWSRTFQPGPLRSLAVLLSEPRPIDPQSIIAAAADVWSQQLFEEDYPDIGEDDDHYVYRLTENTCVLSLDGYRLFVRSATGPFLGDASMLADEYGDVLRENILTHQAWLHVDVDIWPTAGPASDREFGAAIPERGQQLVGSLAMQLAGTKGIIVVDRDSGEMVEVTPELKEAINGDNPASAFLAVPSQ